MSSAAARNFSRISGFTLTGTIKATLVILLSGRRGQQALQKAERARLRARRSAFVTVRFIGRACARGGAPARTSWSDAQRRERVVIAKVARHLGSPLAMKTSRARHHSAHRPRASLARADRISVGSVQRSGPCRALDVEGRNVNMRLPISRSIAAAMARRSARRDRHLRGRRVCRLQLVPRVIVFSLCAGLFNKLA